MTRSETRASSLTGAVVCVSSNGKERERRRLLPHLWRGLGEGR